jgi:hypothetical protein
MLNPPPGHITLSAVTFPFFHVQGAESMRSTLIALVALFVSSQLAIGQELTEEQMGPWSALEKQVALDVRQDWEAVKEFIHPKGCFWGDQLPSPVSVKSNSYYMKLRAGEDEIVGHHLVPVSVVVVDDVAIINFYCHLLTKPEDGKQVERIIRGHNTWKKEGGRWLLLSTYNTQVTKPDGD